MSWQAALAYCDSLSWAGHDDWRLPNRNELQSIVDYGRHDPATDPTTFPGTASGYFWSSSSYHGVAVYAWNVDFFAGHVYNYDKPNARLCRCVRGGP